jgi:hypothetical protein
MFTTPINCSDMPNAGVRAGRTAASGVIASADSVAVGGYTPALLRAEGGRHLTAALYGANGKSAKGGGSCGCGAAAAGGGSGGMLENRPRPARLGQLGQGGCGHGIHFVFVRVHKASCLTDANYVFPMDPYVTASLLPMNRAYCSTLIHQEGGVDPTWEADRGHLLCLAPEKNCWSVQLQVRITVLLS